MGKGGFRNQERPGDLRGREATERPQGEGHPRVERQGRVAAREDESKSIIGDGHVVVRYVYAGAVRRGVGAVRLDGRLTRQFLGLVAQPPAAPEAIDGAVAGRGHDPRGGVHGQSPFRPRLDGRHERLLDGLLGKVEVAQDADQGRDRSPLLVAEQPVDDLAGRPDGGGPRRDGPRQSAAADPAVAAPAGAPSSSVPNSQIGRISTEPWFAPGIRAAQPMAASRSATSTM